MSGLVSFLFKGEIRRTAVIRRGVPVDTDRVSGENIEALRFKLVCFFSWVLSAVLLLCLIGVFALMLAEPSKEVPAWLPPIITGIIGYFGGAIAAYFGVRSA